MGQPLSYAGAMMNVLTIDDHALFRQGLAMLLTDLYSDVMVTEAVGIDPAIELCKNGGAYDLVLLDLQMAGMDGFDGLRLLGEHLPGVPIVILSASESRADIHSAFQGGAKGYIVKSATTRVLKHALRLVLSGEFYVPSLVIETEDENSADSWAGSDNGSTSDAPPKALTPRQLEVLVGMAEGQSNKEIARSLGMLEGTVKVHAKAIFQKLGVNNRTMAVMVGIRTGYVSQFSRGEDSSVSRANNPRRTPAMAQARG